MSHTRQHQFLVFSLGLYLGMFYDLSMIDERVESGPLSHGLDEPALHGEGTSNILVVNHLYLCVISFFKLS